MTTVLTHAANWMVAQAATGAGGSNLMESLIGLAPIIMAGLVIYFLLWRPQAKQRQEHQSLLNQLKKDDEVVTSGGIYGRIVSLEDRVVTIEVSDKVKIKILRDRIAGRWQPAAPTTQQ